jgi:hypothetical protein
VRWPRYVRDVVTAVFESEGRHGGGCDTKPGSINLLKHGG